MVSDLLVSLMGLFFRGPGLINERFAEEDVLATFCHLVPFLTWAGLYASSLAGRLSLTTHPYSTMFTPLPYSTPLTVFSLTVTIPCLPPLHPSPYSAVYNLQQNVSSNRPPEVQSTENPGNIPQNGRGIPRDVFRVLQLGIYTFLTFRP